MAGIETSGSDGGDQDAPKIIIDSDWKAQAQAEKEKLAEKERTEAASGAGGQGDRMPEADFRGLVRTLATQAIMYLGGIPDPETGRAVVIPEYAQFQIDLLGVLEEKTKGNLSEEEREELEVILHELRMRFAEIMGSVAEHMRREEAAKGTGAGGAGIPND
jgi:hypothetical protein